MDMRQGLPQVCGQGERHGCLRVSGGDPGDLFMAEEGMGEMGTSFASKGDPGNRYFTAELSADEAEKCFGSIQVLCDLGISRKPGHEMAVDQVDVILPTGPEELEFPNLKVRELLTKREEDDSLVQIPVAGRWFEQSAHSSELRLFNDIVLLLWTRMRSDAG